MSPDLNRRTRSHPTSLPTHPERSVVAIETAKAIVQELFAIGLDLASCAEMVHSPAAERLAKAVDDLDTVIAHIRAAIFSHILEGPDVVGDPVGTATPGGVEELVAQIGSLAGRVSDLAQTVPIQGTAVTSFLDAIHALHRARIGLTAEPYQPE